MTLLGRMRLRCLARVVFPEHVAPLQTVKEERGPQSAHQPNADQDDSSFLGHLATRIPSRKRLYTWFDVARTATYTVVPVAMVVLIKTTICITEHRSVAPIRPCLIRLFHSIFIHTFLVLLADSSIYRLELSQDGISGPENPLLLPQIHCSAFLFTVS